MFPIGYILADTYRITRLLGRGGMAHVYEVAHVRLPTRSAVKVITGDMSMDVKFIQRFRQEAEILAQLHHPHVVQVLDWNQTKEGQPYLVMELLEGEDLAQRIRRTGAMQLAEALPIFLQIGDALQAVHDQNIIHRDLKPANVFLLRNGAFPNYAKVLDFGIAKAIDARAAVYTKKAELLGTPAYMAPEQARGIPNAASVRSDQFALALVLYEMLSGRSPFYVAGEDLLQTLARVLLDEPAPLPYPQIEPALRRALSKAPEERFASIRDFIVATGALELSVIRPLLAYTRPLPLLADPPDEIEVTSAELRPLAAEPQADSSLAQRDELSTLRHAGLPGEALAKTILPPLPTGSQRKLFSVGAAPGQSPTLSRPSITGQKIATVAASRWPLTLVISCIGVPLVVVGVSGLVYWRDILDYGLRATAPASGTSLPRRSSEQAAPIDEPRPLQPASSKLGSASIEPEKSERAALVVDASFGRAPADSRGTVRSEGEGNTQTAESPRATPVAPRAAVPHPTDLPPRPHPSSHRISRRRIARSTPTASPKLADTASALAKFTVQTSAPEGLTDAQREFTLACVSSLPASAQAPIATQPLELGRAGGRPVVISDQLAHADMTQLERCLLPMEEQMSLPRHMTVRRTNGEPDKGRKE